MPHSFEQRIRMKAYELWLKEGRPEGGEARHWEMAKQMVGRQQMIETLQESALKHEDDNAVKADAKRASRR